MLTIYNRLKESVGALRPSGPYADVADVTVKRRLNSDYSLSFLLNMNSPKYSLIEEEGLIECEGQKYIIKGRKRNRQGMGRTVLVTCPHVMRRMIDIRIPYSSAQAEALGKDITYFTNILSTATGGVFTFQIMDTFPLKDVYKWGYSNCLTAFQDIIKAYGAEFVPDNYNIKIYQKISINNGIQYRYAKNIIDSSFETNTNTLCTRMTGLAKDSLTIIDLPSSNLTSAELALLSAVPGAIVGGLIKVPYLISAYAATWATPDNAFFDAEFEANEIDASDVSGKLLLLAEIRKKLAAAEVPEFQVQINAVDLWKKDSTEVRPQLGETVYVVDSEMELPNITARIMEITENPFDLSKNAPVTLANYILKDDKDLYAELSASKNLLDGLMTNKKINTSEFETFAKQAVIDINNSKTEVRYDVRGIVLQDKINALNQVVMSANGIYLTTNGGTSTLAAITAAGVIAERITGILGVFAQVKTDNIIAGTALITSALIDSIKANKIDVTTGKITTAQIDNLIVGTNVQIGTAQDAAGVTTIVGNTVTTGYINAKNVVAASVQSSWVYAGAIYANQITVGGGTIADALLASGTSWNQKTTQINSSGIYTGTLTAAQVNAVAINANSITVGTLTGININGTNITGSSTITGATIKTAASGTRVELTSNLADVNLYNGATNILRLQDNIDGTVTIWNPSGGSIYIGTTETIYPRGVWNFSGATVTNLNVTAKLG